MHFTICSELHFMTWVGTAARHLLKWEMKGKVRGGVIRYQRHLDGNLTILAMEVVRFSELSGSDDGGVLKHI